MPFFVVAGLAGIGMMFVHAWIGGGMLIGLLICLWLIPAEDW